MLFLIFIIAIIVFTVLFIKSEWDSIGLGIVCGLSWVAGVVSVLVFAINYIGADANIESSIKRYESLTYQYENDIYDNDNDLGKKELMDDIQEWNEDLAFNKSIQNNFWVGILVPDIYDELEFIELD